MHDIRFAIRQLFKEPRFTAVALLALALGIGANTAIFSVVDSVLLKPLPFPQPEQLVALGAIDVRVAQTERSDPISLPNFSDLRAHNRSFAFVAVHRPAAAALSGEGEPQSLRAEHVSAEFFDVLGIRPALGRTFQRAEEAPGGGPDGLTAVLSDAFWQRQFKGDRAILGRKLILDGQPFTVVGVMPPPFQYPINSDPAEVYITSALDAVSTDGTKPPTESRGSYSWIGSARLKPGVSFAQGLAEVRTVSAALEKQYPDSNAHFWMTIAPLRRDLIGDVSTALYVLFGAVACVLLIASANVANLLLARAIVRGKEMALRSALGASRARIFRQLLTESVLLSAIGGALGLLLAIWGIDLLVALIPQNIPRISNVHLDGVVLAFTLLVSLGTGIVFGLAPAMYASRLDLRSALNDSTRATGGAARSHHGLRNALVISEVALALILLIGAGLLLQSFARLSRVDPGVQPERLLTAFVALPSAAYPKPENIVTFYDQLLPRLRALPGVASASAVFPLPLSGSNMTFIFDIKERPRPKGEQASCPMRIAASDYFHTMGIPLRRGRVFDARDHFKSNPVVVVNEKFVEEQFPGEEVIGKKIQPGIGDGAGPICEIVGVVANVKHKSLRNAFTSEIYLPEAQVPFDVNYLVVRTNTSHPSTLTAAVRAEVARLNSGVPLTRTRVFDEYLMRSLTAPRFNALLLSIFAGVALVLTAIGIYGVMAYSVAQRRQEIGIRMALGAQKQDVLRLVIGGGMKLTALGVFIGLGAAFGLTRLLGNMLYGVKPFDGPTMIAVALLLASIAMLACWLPARRAAGSNPLIALREQ